MPEVHAREVGFTAPADDIDALTGWAGVYGRKLDDELRLAVKMHLARLALAELRRPDQAERLAEEGLDGADAIGLIEQRLDDLCIRAYTRPSIIGLIERECAQGIEETVIEVPAEVAQRTAEVS